MKNPVLHALLVTLVMASMTSTVSMAKPYHAVNCRGEPISEGVPHPNGGGLILGDGQVENSVYVGRKAVICGGTISGNVVIKGPSVVVDASVSGNAVVRNSLIHSAEVSGNARIVEGSVWRGAAVSGNARILDGASVGGAGSRVYGNAKVSGFNTQVIGFGEVYGSALVHGEAVISGKVDCGQWTGITVTTDQTGKCGENGQTSLGAVLSNPIDEGNTESE